MYYLIGLFDYFDFEDGTRITKCLDGANGEKGQDLRLAWMDRKGYLRAKEERKKSVGND